MPTVDSVHLSRMLGLVVLGGMAACVPSDPSRDQASQKAAKTTPKPPTNKTRSPRALSDGKASTSLSNAQVKPPSKPLGDRFFDDFERTSMGPDWDALSPKWRIENGQLCGQGAKNKGVWLLRTLPDNARIEFEAVSFSPDGDIKAELWGDGRSGATSLSYTDATSYLTIFGGWKNHYHVLARINEHDKNRLEVPVDRTATDGRSQPVVPGRTYAFKVERTDGKTVSWWVDGQLIHRFEDAQPLRGAGHDHMGFNEWDARVCFDNVTITPI